MTVLDTNDFEKNIEVPPLEDEETLPEIVQHMAELGDAIDKCEKMLQHLAVGNYSEDFNNYMSQHIHLIAERNELYKKMKFLEEKNTVTPNTPTFKKGKRKVSNLTRNLISRLFK